MTRMLAVLLATSLAVLVLPAAFAAEQAPTWQPTKLSDSLYELRADVGYVVKVLCSIGPDGTLLVDAGPEELGKDLLATIAALGGSAPRIVILSHGHVEHWGGIRVLGGAPLYVGHDRLRRRLQSGAFRFLDLPDALLPRLTVDDGLTLHFNGEEIRLRSFAGAHDDSDLVVWFKRSNVAFVGALVTALHLPTVDAQTGDIRRYPEVTRRVLEYLPADVTLVPGHGENATRAQALQFLEMLDRTTDLVRSGIASGKDLDTLAREDVLAPWTSWEVSYADRAYWLRALYEGHTGASASRQALKPIHDQLYAAYKAGGSEAAVRAYAALKATSPSEYRFDERTLYGIASVLASERKHRDAIPFFELGLREFPNGRFARAFHDGLARAYAELGDRVPAIRHLERLLELEPGNEDARRLLDSLKAGRAERSAAGHR